LTTTAKKRGFVGRAVRGVWLLIGLAVLWLFAVWPPPVWYRSHWPAETAFMEMRGGKDRLYQPVSLDSIVKSARKAVTTGEDDNFWVHHGIDYQSLRHALGYRRNTFSWNSARDRKALLPLLTKAWTRRDALRGASTITQQLAKNLYLSPSRNPLRKVKEAVTAYRLEGAMSKGRILELYLNVVELGNEVWGFEAGSRKYFNRSAGRLSAEQAAALAATLPFPLSSNPGFHPGRMRWRQQLILRRMRGEDVEVPKLETEIVPIVPSPVLPVTDSLQPVIPESLVPPPPDSILVPEVTPDSG
jgi:monofunctional biosynthetic peptidoglycan transglycosylase